MTEALSILAAFAVGGALAVFACWEYHRHLNTHPHQAKSFSGRLTCDHHFDCEAHARKVRR